MIQILDSTAPFDFFAKNGYYKVGNCVAVHSGPAYQEASRTGLPVQWHFNDEVYNKFDWRSRLNLSVSELYRMRAQQLRNKYDYLILWFSGGADSSTILESFLYNNIRLDEIVIVWPRSLTAGKYTPNLNTDPSNFVSEWEYSIKPKLDWVAQNHPEVRITVLDQFVDMPAVEDHEDTWTLIEKHNFPAIHKQRLMDHALRERSQTHKNIASIAGNSPPAIAVLDNAWLAVYFENNLASSANGKSDYLLDGTPRNVEYFYWTPDFPELLREQAHVILEHLNSNPMAKDLFFQHSLRTHNQNLNALNDSDIRELRRQLIKKLIYPNWISTTFQSKKPKGMYIQPEIYTWFFTNPESEQFLQSWKSAIRSQYSLIKDSTWFDTQNGTDGFKNFFSKFYPIGRLTSN